MNFVFTGTAEVDGIHYLREDLTRLANINGHTVQSQVRYDTHYLVCANDSTEKAKKARRLGVATIPPETFIKMMFVK